MTDGSGEYAREVAQLALATLLFLLLFIAAIAALVLRA